MSPPIAAPSFPPRSAAPVPPSSMRPTRTNTQSTTQTSHSGHAPYTPSALTPAGGAYQYPSSNGYNRHSPPMPSGGNGYPFDSRQQSYSRSTDSHGGYRNESSAPSSYPQSQYKPNRNSGGSTGLAYDQPDTDVDVDAYSDNRGPAPSYYQGGSQPRRLIDEKNRYGGR